jgi:flagellar hook-basal body complex protein FliE
MINNVPPSERASIQSDFCTEVFQAYRRLKALDPNSPHKRLQKMFQDLLQGIGEFQDSQDRAPKVRSNFELGKVKPFLHEVAVRVCSFKPPRGDVWDVYVGKTIPAAYKADEKCDKPTTELEAYVALWFTQLWKVRRYHAASFEKIWTAFKNNSFSTVSDAALSQEEMRREEATAPQSAEQDAYYQSFMASIRAEHAQLDRNGPQRTARR